MTKKVRTYKKVKQVGVLETRLGNYIILEPFDKFWKLYADNYGLTVVPDLDTPPFTNDWKYNMYGISRKLVISRDQFLKFEMYYERPLEVLVWDGNYIEVPDDVEDVQYYFSDEDADEFAFPVTQEEFDRIFDTYYDDKENENENI